MTAEQEEYRQFYVKRTGLVDYNLPNLNLTDGTNYTVNAEHTHRATTGFFGRINYDYKGIYLLNSMVATTARAASPPMTSGHSSPRVR